MIINPEDIKQCLEVVQNEKNMILDKVRNHLGQIDLKKNDQSKTVIEHAAIFRFIEVSGEDISVVKSDFKVPDSIIKWNNETYALEYTKVVDQKKRKIERDTKKFKEQIIKRLIDTHGNINSEIFLGLTFEVNNSNETINSLEYISHKISHNKVKHLTSKERKALAEEISEIIYSSFINNEFDFLQDKVDYLRFRKNESTILLESGGYSCNGIEELVIESIERKESKIQDYKNNTNGLKQCLLLEVSGQNGSSGYSYFDENILSKRGSLFDKVILVNMMAKETFIGLIYS